ncbi:MAG: sulfotransferase [Candidatus Krumholzibacteriales bacterium]
MTDLRKPDFICIGPERTATSSLYVTLKSHPEFHMTPQKEIRYWNEGNLLPAHSVSRALFSSHWHFRQIRKELVKHFARVLLGRAPAPEIGWYLRYAFGRRSEQWYRSLFEKSGSLITGDISPLYYHLQEEDIGRIARYNPEIRIILLVRDPVARTWSKARMNLLRHRGREFREVPESEFRQAFLRIRREWISYPAAAGMWRKYFRNVHTGFFDDLKRSPERFFRDVLEFLGAERIEKLELPDKKTNEGLPIEIPDSFRSLLVEQYRDEIIDMRGSPLGKYAGEWIRKYNL